MKRKVSIIMPVLNGERYLAEALDSILAQTYTNYELVAVDDGSTDRTREILYEYSDRLELRYVHHPVCKGIAVSVNDGIRHSTGEYITFLDHDDVWVPHLLDTQVRHLESRRELGMVHSDFQTINPHGVVIEESVARCRGRKRPSGKVFRELFMDSFIAASSVLIRKECFEQLGGFDETLLWGDYHLWLRIARFYEIDFVPHVLTKYRQHPGQSTRTYNGERPDQESVAMLAIKKLLDTYPEVRQELGEAMIRRRMAMLYFDMAYHWLEKGAHRNSRACLVHCIRRWPTNTTYYLTYALSLLPPRAVCATRKVWRRVREVFSLSSYASARQYGARN